ncbi:hypothetical protein KSF_084970 [Reticulibacter mediterranei]|uniref:Cell envelope-related transcriptional attenuator domain-containing protein n=1 Tax=Reticulibacter mediterranei TaxID=2778369 RepID=A0A8J3IV66_9CHLR|nr:LCP family protein [Reticulibacter mediterranei]GHO98449.1 hypothetical protein KSF_084970 [Reticulibacter mediterranei]
MGHSNRATPTGRSRKGMPPSCISPSQQRKAKRILRRSALILLIFLLLVGSAGYWYYQQNFAQAINTMTGKKAIHSRSKLDATNTAAAQTNSKQHAQFTGGRVTIMLLGSDTDGKRNDVQNGTPLAQIVILVTINPQAKYVGMMSIPRDMQVTDPISGGHPKLAEVFSSGYRGNTVFDRVARAAGRMMDTIDYNYGIHIDHYAWVGLTGFVKIIDTAGGVDIDAIHPMVDDVYPDDTNNPNSSIYDFKRLYIAPGPQHMNGQQTLEYVRTRHADFMGDFGRSARQQQVLTQLKMKLSTSEIIPKAPELLKDLEGSLQTDLTLDQIYPFANFARTIDTNKIDRVTLSPPYSMPSGANTNYLPLCDQITPRIAKMFGLRGNAKCIPQGAMNGKSTAAVASTQPTLSTASTPAPTTIDTMEIENTWQMLGAISQITNVSMPQGSRGFAGIDSLHDLLDLMFCVVFESFDGMKV